jgi:hypothetical protein
VVVQQVPDAVARPAPDVVVQPVPDEVLLRLADLGQVPAAQCKFFFDSVRRNVQTACELSTLVKGGLANEKGATLYRAALELYEMLGNLNEEERKLIEGILGRTGHFENISSGRVGGLRQTAYQFALLFSLVTGKPQPRYPHQAPLPRKRGPKKGTMKDWIYQDFVFDLCTTAKVAGGKLTLEKNRPPFGTLIDAIETLAPYLPDGDALKRLSASTLQRLKTRCDKIKVGLDD